MDRPIDHETLSHRRRRRIAVLAAAIVGAVAVIVILAGWVRPSVDRESIQTARVVRGSVDASLEATGLVVPEHEAVLSSPIDARVTRILRTAGSSVRAGDPIVELDLGESDLQIERLEQQIAQKRNEQLKNRLGGESDVASLTRQLEQKTLDAEMARYRAEQNRKLRVEGLVSDEVARESEVAAKKSGIELDQLRAQIAQRRRSSASEVEGDTLSLDLLERERAEALRQRQLATTRADRDGVVTWVVSQEGATVRRGDVIARVADLRRYRVEATISDVHARTVRSGLAARVRAEGTMYDGVVSSVDPTATNGQVRFFVELSNAPSLHNNQRVEVFIVTETRSSALKVKRGAFADRPGRAEVFVVHGSTAVRRLAVVGLVGTDEVEVVSGLKEGDEVITSDMSEYERIATLRLK